MKLPPRLTIARASRLFRSTLTSQQLCLHSLNLAHFGENALHLNAYTKLLSANDIAEQAAASDSRIKSGQAKSLLDGIPVTVKANIAVGKWWELPTACSAILQGNTSVKMGTDVYESDVARKLLKDCGAVLIGITNMDEFGMGSLGTNTGSRINCTGDDVGQYSPTLNPLHWMQRIHSLTERQTNTDDLDRLFLDLITESTPNNPHGIHDDALQELLEEVKYWMSISANSIDKSKSPLLSPGGSSSGAAAATAHGSSLLSIGTDSGGSLRLPAAWTSTVGFKPTYGSISRYGVVSYASSLDTVGFVTGTSECAAISWKCLNNSNEAKENWDASAARDSTARLYHTNNSSSKDNTEEELNTANTPLEGVRIGIPSAFSLYETPPLISSIWSQGASILEKKGATLVSIPESKLSHQWVKLSCAAYYVLACAEASSNLSRYDGVRYGMECNLEGGTFPVSEKQTDSAFADMTALEQQISATRAYGFGDEVQRRVLAGTSVLSSDRFHTHYEAAAVVRAKLSRSLENLFTSSDVDGVDIILVPTALSFPVVLDPQKGAELDSTSAFSNDVMTIPISLGGFPSVSVPMNLFDTSEHRTKNSPVGLQLFGPRGSEELILKAAKSVC